jgi:hypothetical protein
MVGCRNRKHLPDSKRLAAHRKALPFLCIWQAQASAFLVFQKPILSKTLPVRETSANDLLYTSKGVVITRASSAQSITLKGPWDVRFEHNGTTPVADTFQALHSWHLSKDSGIKYFSGQATYHNTFEVRADELKEDAVLLLALNNVKEIADVYVNGKKVGQHWHPARLFDP